LAIINTHIQMEFNIGYNSRGMNAVVNANNVMAGQEVKYCGTIYGGPIFGSHGIVKKIYARKVLVDMGWLGNWNVPYFYLSEVNVS
jgi:hypothetical protein